MVFDAETRQAHRGGRDLALTAKEGLFLEVMMRNPGRTVTAPDARRAPLGSRERTRLQRARRLRRRLRKKLTEQGEPQVLHTLRGLGYRLEAP